MTSIDPRTPRRRGLAALAAPCLAMSIVLISATAAYATHSATGFTNETGTETGFSPGADYGMGQPHDHCLEVTASDYTVTLSGGTFTIGGKSYTGDATLFWSTDDSYYIDEDGTYTVANHSTGCDLTTRGYPIASTVTLDGSTDANHSISCASSAGDGDYARDAANSGMHITVHFTMDCTATNGTAGTTESVSATFTGQLHPCDGSLSCPVSYIDNGNFSF